MNNEHKKLSDARLGEIREYTDNTPDPALPSIHMIDDLLEHIDFITADNEKIKSCKPPLNKQASRTIPALFHHIDEIKLERDRLSQECAVYREASIFYSNDDAYADIHNQLDWDLVNNPAAIQDRGKHAREALAKGGEIRDGVNEKNNQA